MVLLVGLPPGIIDADTCQRKSADTCLGVEYAEEAMCRVLQESARSGHEPRVVIGKSADTLIDAPVLDVECMCPCRDEDDGKADDK